MNTIYKTKIMFGVNCGLIILATLIAVGAMTIPAKSFGYGGYTYNGSYGYGGGHNYNYYPDQYYQVPNPTVNIYADSTSISYGDSTRINWNSSNATYCNASGGSNGWSGSKNTSGNFYTGTLTSTTTFNINCNNSNGGQVSGSVTVYVNNYNYNNNQNNYYSNTSVTISADQTTVPYNGSTVIRWYPINATSCTATGGSNGWAGTRNAFSGSFNTGPLSYTTTYTISCNNYNNNYYGNYNNYDTRSVTIFVGNQNQIANNSLTATTTNATSISNTSAQLNSLITNSGNDSTNAWFEWGKTISLGNITATTPIGAQFSIAHAETIVGLSPGTTYYFRAVAENSSWRNIGSILSFTTSGQNAPIVIHEPTIKTPPTSLVSVTSSVDHSQPIVPTIDNSRPHPGDEINYTVSYQNVGTGAITGVTLQIALPQGVSYISSNINNPNIFGNNLTFNLGTLKANNQSAVTIRVLLQNTAIPGTILNFPAILNYIDPSNSPQSVTANASAQVWSEPASVVAPIVPPASTNMDNSGGLGANALGAGFLPTNLFGWLFLIILVLFLILIAKYLLDSEQPFPFRKKTTTTTTVQH